VDYGKNKIKIQNLPQTIINPLNPKNNLQLIGIVDFKVPISTRGSTENSIEHYTSIVQRQGSWMEYNDLLPREKKIKKPEINPHLLVYIQNE